MVSGVIFTVYNVLHHLNNHLLVLIELSSSQRSQVSNFVPVSVKKHDFVCPVNGYSGQKHYYYVVHTYIQ